jgi:hypothetical protein
MDELLRAYAKKRREQGEPPLQMHPATRKLLQDEVKRTLVAAPAAPRRSWRTLRWPLAAMGVGFAALMVMFAMINTQMRSLMPVTATADREVAQAKSAHGAPASIAEGTASPAPMAAAAEDKVAAFKKSPAPPPGTPPATAAGSIAAAAPAAPAQGSETLLQDTAASGQPASVGASYGARSALGAAAVDARAPLAPALSVPTGTTAPTATDASAPPPNAANAMTRESTQATPKSDASYVSAGEFVQIPQGTRGQAKQSTLTNVLSSFQVRRSGQNVSIVDADGSVYVGHVLNEISPRRGRGGAGSIAGAGTAETRKDINDNANWRFTVEGTNMQLQQKVIFTGSVRPMRAAGGARSSFEQNLSASPAQNTPAAAAVPTPIRSRITGKVQVGGGKEFEIEAEPPSP